MAKIKLRAFPTFVLRTPLFPLSALDDPERTMQQPCFREALYLASPDLYTFTGDKTEDAEEKGDAAALKYFLRACSRCTPFGLFAGCSTGRFGSSTQIAVAEPTAARRTTRLDMQYLCALIQRIERHGAVRRQLRLFPNDTLYEIAGQYRYIEYFHRGKKTEHQMASVEITPELTAVFALARDGATFDTLAGSLVDDEITREEAEAYIDELIASSLLTTELAPAIVGDDILTTLVRKLQRLGDTEYAPMLACVQERLAAIDARPPGTTQEEYAKIERLIEPLGVPYDVKFLFQADLFRPAQAQLSTGVLTDLKEYVDFVGSISGTYQNGNLQAFQQAFVQRYETEEVPLMLALDNELGLGYPYAQGSHNDVNPVIDGIVPSYDAQGGQTGGYSATDVLLLKKYIEAMKRDAEEITIDEKDFPNRRPEAIVYPDTIPVMFNLLRDDADGRSIYLKSVGSNGGANLLGRFCHTDASIDALVREVADYERQANEGKIIAEIAHITEARIGNISSRPVFRDYVIDYLSNLDETLAERIPASDLILSVRKGRFYLRSKRFDKEVIPRLTCAHNYSLSPIPMYRFLADMQSLQRTQGFGFAVGSLFSTLDYMPRIRYKNIVLSRRRWKLNYDGVKAFSAYRTEEHRKAFAGYMAERRLPRRVVHPMGDNELLLDLHDDRCVRLLFSLLRKYKTVSVEEFLFDTEHAVVHDEQANGYTNEMIVILHK